MRISARTVFVVVAIIAAVLSFREVSGRVVDWVKAMHGVGPAAHGSK
jgi:uncharacterized membrane protein YtjA (UPF0391 family)